VITKLLEKTTGYIKNPSPTEASSAVTEEPEVIELLPAPDIDQTARLLDDEIKTPPSIFNRFTRRLRNPWRKSSAVTDHEQDLHHRLEIAFEALHREFDEREQALQQQLAEAAKVYEKKIRRSKWLLIPAAIVATISLGYIFYMVQLMGSAMTSISTDITAMNGSVSDMGQNMSTMSADTRQMVGSIQGMNQSMGYLNRNVGAMNQNVGAMNQNMGAMNHNVAAMNHSIAPIGNMARPAGNFMGAMKSFMPF
jgi:hypothetical protein